MKLLVIPLMILISTSTRAQNYFLGDGDTEDLAKLIHIPSQTEINYSISTVYDPAPSEQLNQKLFISRALIHWKVVQDKEVFINLHILTVTKKFSPVKKWSAGFTVQDYINVQWKEKQFSFDSFLSAECEPVSRIDLTPEH